MGKFEKLVVLTVLFVAAIVLAISFNKGGADVEASDPLSGARELLDQDGLGLSGTETPPAELPSAGASETAPSLLLNAGLDSAPAAGLRPTTPGASTLTLEPEIDTSHRILGDTSGLRPSFLDEYMMYTVVVGDTWSSLAQRFYQDGQFTRNLSIANEGMAELVPGNEILVPVFDLLAEGEGSGEREPAPEASFTSFAPPAGASTLASDVVPAVRPLAKPTQPAVSGAKLAEYVVRPGDTLSDISLAVFGSAGRWQEILDANTDKLRKPESLQAGMKLKIPVGGKVPVASAKSEPKSETAKPKTVQVTDKPASTKKRKVL